MPYTIQYQEEGYIRLVYEGEARIDDLKDILARGAVLAREHNCLRILSDFRAMTLQLSLYSLYSVAEIQKEVSQELNMPLYNFKRVVVVPQGNYHMFKFFENVAVNRMHKIRIFTEYEDALQWLLED